MYYTTFSIPQILMSVTTAPVTLTQQDVKITKAVTSVFVGMDIKPPGMPMYVMVSFLEINTEEDIR